MVAVPCLALEDIREQIESARVVWKRDQQDGVPVALPHQLAIAQVPVKIVRTQDGNGIRNPSGFALMVVDADSAEMRRVDGHDTGMIFVTSRSPEEMIQGIQAELDKTAQKTKPAAKDSAH